MTAATAPVKVGDWVALGLRDRTCPVGEVEFVDGTWVTVRLKDFWTGGLTERVVSKRWDDVVEFQVARAEDKVQSCAVDGPNFLECDWGGCKCEVVMNDKHLGEFQTAWKRVPV